MGYFNAVHGWPSFDAITESAQFTGTIPAGRVVTKNGSTGKFELAGNADPAARVPYIAITDSTDLDVAKVDNDAALYPNSLQAVAAAGTSGGNLPTLALSQAIEFDTDQYLGTPAAGQNLTFYGAASGETTAASLGKLRVAATGEPIVARCTKAAASLRELPGVTVIRAIAAAYGQLAA